ncbi:CRIB domain-containing protein RIC7-like [Salvia miltiorrhiza]|uniref:CRIB domain-containing protein RIC7-like n=1 Tax=Salvia miltiorrhiza TaxID=226208 RepID=UPI0025ACAD18|nr:CRIB domain-containing protein RIC7-like [Salvia miltiorrhiza]
MSTKMKGLFKGLRYISQIFDEEQQKEQDIQIGLPTDVKHVAHIGWDGPASANSGDSPSWMKDMGPSTPGIAAPFDSKPGKDNSDVKWVSEDSKRAQKTKKSQEKEQHGEGTKPSRRRSTDNNPLDTEKPSRRQSSAGDASAKPRQPRRTHPKDSSDAKPQDPDAPKKTRRKKSEANDQAGSRRSKNRSAAANGVDAPADPASDATQKQLSEDDEERESRE